MVIEGNQKLVKSFKTFLKHDASSGILLLAATIFALLLANTPLSTFYKGFLAIPVMVQFGDFIINKPLLLWINDGLMAVFFFLIGLEIKREMVIGELSTVRQALLPVIAAFGGLLVPALIYVYFNYDDPLAMRGWGIPVATDIAFALGVLAILGDRAPRSLKVLLLSLAIIDDLAAIIIIAVFYTAEVSMLALALSSCGFVVALMMNRFGVRRIGPYILVGIFMWACVLQSGVHATLAGVALAFTIPLRGNPRDGSVEKQPPLVTLEHVLHPWVAFFIMPTFAFANAGVALAGFSIEMLTASIPLGIMTGLFFGKQIGVFGFIWLAVMAGICRKPPGVKWIQIYGLSFLTGIGFTMSLFIGSLAFEDPDIGRQVRLAVLLASFCSATCGYWLLRLTGEKNTQATTEKTEPDVVAQQK